MENCITIQQKKEEILIKIQEYATQEEITKELKEKIKKLAKMYQEDKTPIYVVGKVLKNKEIEEIRSIIKEEIDVEIKFDSPKVLGLHSIRKVFERDVNTSETQFYRGSLRSGQKLEFEGSIVIIGDVKGGAEIIAGENIAVIGELRGLAHAGAKGNKKASIAAAFLDAPQIRIANIVKELAKPEQEENKQSYAYIEGEEIKIEKI